MLEFAAGRQNNGVELASFLPGYVGAFRHALTPLIERHFVLNRNCLARQRDQGRTIRPRKSRCKSTRRFLGVTGSNDVEVRDHAKTADGFDRLMRGTVLAHPDRIVRKKIDYRQFREGGETNRRPAIVGKGKKSGAGRFKNAMVGNPVHNGAHPMLANPESDIATTPVFRIEVFVAVYVVQG